MYSSAGDGGRARGQTGPLGYILVFAVVIAGVSVLVLFGGNAVSDLQGQAELQRADHSMTLFDSRAAMVALGDSDVQEISFGQDSGSFEIEEDTGWIRVTHTNYTDDSTARTEVIYNGSLGRFIYENGDRQLAYQGGGVWEAQENGRARMISPPEFHYRSATLTLPIIRLSGAGTHSGNARVSVRGLEQARNIYPNQTAPTAGNEIGAPYNDTDLQYGNPVKNGTVNVTVRSRYYQAWGEYFRQRTTGDVTVWDVNNTVRLQLQTIGGPPGGFSFPPEDESVSAGGMDDDHPLTEFEFSLRYSNGNNNHVSLWDSVGNQEIEIHIYPLDSVHNDCNGAGGPPSSDVYVSVYYYDGDGSQEYDYWETTIPAGDSSISWSCDGNNARLDIDLLNSVQMDYDNNAPGVSCGAGGNKYHFNQQIGECGGSWDQGDTVLEGHSPAWEPASYTAGTTGTSRTIEEITNHYLSLVAPNTELTSELGPGGSPAIDPPNSEGTLNYETSTDSQFVTYLHITENEVEIDFD